MRVFLFRLVLVATIFLLTVSAFGQDKPSDPWLLFAKGDRGSINTKTTRQDLVRLYGAKNVVDGDLELGEGETESGTVLFPNDPERSIEILWNDTKTKAEPSSLTIRGTRSLWKTLHDISLGTSLKQLEQFNGKPFHMSGYGWDYSGTVMSWDEGALAHDLGEFDRSGIENGRIILRMTCSTPNAEPITKDENNQIQGDRNFSSGHPVLQKMNPCVGEMVWIFPANTKN
jgi:hypothetical protein